MRQLSLFKGKRQRGVKPPLALEFNTHCMVADAFERGKKPGWLLQHIPSGELRTKATAGKLKRMGHKPGWADFVLVGPQGQHFYLELKRGRAPQNEAQKQFGHDMLARGVPYEIARSFTEAIAILTRWGAVRLSVMA